MTIKNYRELTEDEKQAIKDINLICKANGFTKVQIGLPKPK